MSQLSNYHLMARYNRWMNAKIYDAAATLTSAQLQQQRGAFFGSIIATLNHLLVADILWLQRFANQYDNGKLAAVTALTPPSQLDQILYPELPPLSTQRQWLDQQLYDWVMTLTELQLAGVLTYRNSKGVLHRKPFAAVLQHFFNHQTHHRGQLSTLLFQAGVDVGVTDLLALIDNEGV